MYYGLSGLEYVDASLTHRERFKYGRVATITTGPGGFPLTSRWATTYDNFTVELLGIAQRYINQNVITREDLLLLVDAHSPLGTQLMCGTTDPRMERPYLLGDPSTMLAQLLYTVARQPSLKVTIYGLYTDYLAQSGLLRVEPIGDVLKDASLNSQSIPVGHEYARRISAGSFDSVLEALSFEIRPTFDYPDMATEQPTDMPGLVFCLIETLLTFVLFPKMAKFIGYELANRIRWVMSRVAPLRWTEYVHHSGFIRNMPGVDQRIPRAENLSNVQRPNIFYPAGMRNAWAPMRVISELITPIGRRRNRDRARNANLPIFDEFVFVPWDDPGNDVYGESRLTHRIRSILSFVQTIIVPILKKELSQTTSVISRAGLRINCRK